MLGNVFNLYKEDEREKKRKNGVCKKWHGNSKNLMVHRIFEGTITFKNSNPQKLGLWGNNIIMNPTNKLDSYIFYSTRIKINTRYLSLETIKE